MTCSTRCARAGRRIATREWRWPEGYRIFLPTVPQEVYHFTDYAAAQQEYMGHFDPAHPGSLLYVKNASGDYVLVGAMYSAPADYTHEQLDAMIPLSVARWHAHTNICLPNGHHARRRDAR